MTIPPMLSPYFSPTKKRAKRIVSDELPTFTVLEPPEHLEFELEAEDLPNDPLFCYYFRVFLDLYRQLAVVKPDMIQG